MCQETKRKAGTGFLPLKRSEVLQVETSTEAEEEVPELTAARWGPLPPAWMAVHEGAGALRTALGRKDPLVSKLPVSFHFSCT